MVEKGKLRNERDVVLQWRPWWEGLPLKSWQPASSNQMDVDIWWLSLSSRAFNGRAMPLTVCLEGVPHFFYISVSHLQNQTINKEQIDFSSFRTWGIDSGSVFITSFWIDPGTFAYFLLLTDVFPHVSDVLDHACTHTGVFSFTLFVYLESRPPAIWMNRLIQKCCSPLNFSNMYEIIWLMLCVSVALLSTQLTLLRFHICNIKQLQRWQFCTCYVTKYILKHPYYQDKRTYLSKNRFYISE